MKQLVLNAETLLYAVALSGADGIFGVRNVIAGMEQNDFPALKERAEDELLRLGTGDMDFDGNFTIGSDLSNILKTCTEPERTISLDMRQRGKQQHFVLFSREKEAVIMQDVGQNRYQFNVCMPGEIGAKILQLLPLPENTMFVGNSTVESGILRRHDVQEIMEQGCDEQTAKLIVGALAGDDLFCSMQVLKGDKNHTELFFAANGNGILQIGLDYSNDQEDVTFSPIGKNEMVSAIKSAICL